MENKAHALMAGIFTIVLLIAAVLISLWFNRDRVERVPYQIATKLSVPGLNPQAAVRYRGLDIGRVDAISFDPKVPGQILIHISVRPDAPITKGTFAVLGYQGVTGIAYVQLDDDGADPQAVASSKNAIARIDMRPSLLDQLETRGLAILVQTEELTKRFNNLLQPANQKAMLDAFDNVGKAAIEVETIPRQLGPTLAKLPALTADARAALASVTRLADSTTRLTGNLDSFASKLQAPDGPVARFSNTFEEMSALANRVEFETLPLARDARSSLRAVNRTLDNFNERPQSILFGAPGTAPGPGESGFVAPTR
jgi:phospholipid/cholesterol/gamma-HCH transport system substrate-binding protein